VFTHCVLWRTHDKLLPRALVVEAPTMIKLEILDQGEGSVHKKRTDCFVCPGNILPGHLQAFTLV
jgi:hypothetical protein